MTIQYNVAAKVMNKESERLLQQLLTPYGVFTDRSHNLEDTCFSREQLPYVGEVIVMKTLKQAAAQKAYEVWSGIEGIIALPITECDWDEDKKRIDDLRAAKAKQSA